ncbi:hypothetical protein, partial [Klebsiella aerogenes]|uniref:hypothetical protein n=1 Tax=Klebsiella aerogenes TaxID=548 RepID=UPI001CBE8FF1
DLDFLMRFCPLFSVHGQLWQWKITKLKIVTDTYVVNSASILLFISASFASKIMAEIYFKTFNTYKRCQLKSVFVC